MYRAISIYNMRAAGALESLRNAVSKRTQLRHPAFKVNVKVQGWVHVCIRRRVRIAARLGRGLQLIKYLPPPKDSAG